MTSLVWTLDTARGDAAWEAGGGSQPAVNWPSDAVGNGTADDTDAVLAAYDDTPPGGTLWLPDAYKMTEPLVISKSIAVQGSGIAAVVGAAADSANGSGPLTAPYLVGSMIVPSTPGQNAIEIVGTGVCVNLRDFGVRFSDEIMFTDTGHGIFARSDSVVGAGHDLGPYSSLWSNLYVFGHDGNHYGYDVTNPLLCTLMHLRAFGGGVIHMNGEADATKTGNTVVIHPYGWMFCGGTADAYRLEAREDGLLNLLKFERPQAVIGRVPAAFSGLGIADPTNAQYLWRHVGGVKVDRISIDDRDLEGYELGNPVDFGGQGANVIVRSGGIVSVPINDYDVAEQRMPIDQDAEEVTLTAGLGVGVGGSVSAPFGATDAGGTIRAETDGSPGEQGSLICSVRFAHQGYRRSVSLDGCNTTESALIKWFDYGLDQAGFDVYAGEKLAGNSTYDFHFSVVKAYP